MGKTPKPLRILVDQAIATWPEIEALKAKGHEVEVVDLGWDLVLGGACWRMNQALRRYLDVAVAAARKQRYPKEKSDD